jgi:hypothetical protein
MNQQPLPLRIFVAQVIVAATCLTQGSPARAEVRIAQETGSATPATAPAPMLITIHGTEQFFCMVLPVQFGVGDYDFEVFRDGSTQGAVFWRIGTSQEDPPTGASVFHGTLTPTELTQLEDRINAARLGIQGACQADFPFLRNGVVPRQHVYWFGRTVRVNDFVLFEGPPCPNAVDAVVQILQAHFPTLVLCE